MASHKHHLRQVPNRGSASSTEILAPLTADDTKDLRRALGQFATGVTIVTACRADGEPVGVTANSFNSVSLDPPLVLWSLSTNAYSRETFEQTSHFCVHVLAADQQALSERFACAGADKFSGVEWSTGIAGVPLLSEHAALFQCRLTNRQLVGDHIIFIGEVLMYMHTDRRPLVFYDGSYAQADRRRMEKVARRAASRGHFASDRRKT